MARLQLNKSSLAREATKLQTYQRVLPSLDVKRRQLMVERAKAERALAETQASIEAVRKSIREHVPMLANTDISLERLVTVSEITYGEERAVGVKLPTLDELTVTRRPYHALGKPHWVDYVGEKLEQSLRLHLELAVQSKRVELLNAAVKTVSQRVNLFERVLIPQAKDNIKRIRIYLSDQQVSAVVRSKIAKRKRAAATANTGVSA